MVDLLSKLLLRTMREQDTDPLSVTAPGDLTTGRSDNSARGQELETLAKEVRRPPFRITVDEAEVVNEAISVTYTLAVCSAEGEHRLNKSYRDIERLREALLEELPTVMLPRLPRPRAREQLVDRGFRTRLGVYFFCLACNQSAIETVTFRNFIQLAEDAQQPLQGPQEREVANGQTPHIGDGCLHASSKRVRFATSLRAQAATQAPLDRTAPQGPTSPLEASAPPAIMQPHRRKTRRGRAWCVVCFENPQEMAIDPCGHMSMCEECMKSVKDCPICRGPIHKAMKIIIAKRHRSGETTEYVSW